MVAMETNFSLWLTRILIELVVRCHIELYVVKVAQLVDGCEFTQSVWDNVMTH